MGLVSAAVALALIRVPDIRALELLLYDLRAQWRAEFENPSDEIIVLALDNESLKRMDPAVGRLGRRDA